MTNFVNWIEKNDLQVHSNIMNEPIIWSWMQENQNTMTCRVLDVKKKKKKKILVSGLTVIKV